MIPEPLHPAIVHFPIVLLLLGAPIAIIAIFVRRWHLPWLAALVITAGAVGAIAATWTGNDEEEMVGEISQRADSILDEHEDWGERTRNVAIFAVVLAIIAAGLTKLPVPSIAVGVLCAITSIGAAVCVAQAGHYGGLLVYKHGVGINTAAGANASDPGSVKSDLTKKDKKDDDDDD